MAPASTPTKAWISALRHSGASERPRQATKYSTRLTPDSSMKTMATPSMAAEFQ